MSENIKRKAKNIAKQKVKNMVKKTAKAGGKKPLVMLVPYLPAICIFLLVFFMASVLVAVAYSAMVPQSATTGVNPSPEDTYIVNKGNPSIQGGPSYELSPRSSTQIKVGIFMLSELGLKYTNWESSDWKDDTLPVLAFYGGYGNNFVKAKADDVSYIRVKSEGYREVKVVWPVTGYYTITTRYNAVDGLHPDGHKGIDIAADKGSTVVSASAGQVAFAGWENESDHGQGFGQFVIVRDATHDYYYAHLSEINVSPYQVLQPGDMVGKIGSTGRSTGPHLHLQVNDITGYPVDPMTHTGYKE